MASPYYISPIAQGPDCTILKSDCHTRNPELQFKVVIVGDSGCGKTSLFSCYILGSFPMAYEPTIFENHRTFVNLNNITAAADLWDTAGQEEYERLRRLSYQDADIVIIAYSFESSTTLSNITEVWAPESMTYAPNAKIILVGLKSDIDNSNINPVFAGKIAQSIGAVAHLDCSSIQMYNVNKLFNVVFNTAYNTHMLNLNKNNKSNTTNINNTNNSNTSNNIPSSNTSNRNSKRHSLSSVTKFKKDSKKSSKCTIL